MLHDIENHETTRYTCENLNVFDASPIVYNEDGMLMLSTTIADFEFDFEFRKSQVWESFLDDNYDEPIQYCPSPAISNPDREQEDEEEAKEFLPASPSPLTENVDLTEVRGSPRP